MGAGHRDGDGDAAARGAGQDDLDAPAPGQTTDHEEAEDLGRGQVEPFAADQAGVLLLQPLGAHPEPVVDDLDQGAAAGAVPGPQDDFDAAGRRERDRVLQQFGEHEREVADDVGGDGDIALGVGVSAW